MDKYQKTLKAIFTKLNYSIEVENKKRVASGEQAICHADIKILGQTCLLANNQVSPFLTLNQTADLDALLDMENFAKENLKRILKKYALTYDEDSYLIWIPNDSKFLKLFELKYVSVYLLDPESALLSKAIKSPDKNKQLIRQAIATEKFPELISRIIKHHGNLENFI